jgi:hypothetical protein
LENIYEHSHQSATESANDVITSDGSRETWVYSHVSDQHDHLWRLGTRLQLVVHRCRLWYFCVVVYSAMLRLISQGWVYFSGGGAEGGWIYSALACH